MTVGSALFCMRPSFLRRVNIYLASDFMSPMSLPLVSLLLLKTVLEIAEQLQSGETAANFFGDDILGVAKSSLARRYVSAKLAPTHLPNTSFMGITIAVGFGLLVEPNAVLTGSIADAEVLVAEAGKLGGLAWNNYDERSSESEGA